MKALRFLVAGLLGLAAGVGTVWGIGRSGLAGEQGLAGGIYSSLVIYPAGLMVCIFAFWIVFAAMDPGSDK